MPACLLQDPAHDVAMKVQGQSATRSDICRLEDLISAMQQQPDALPRVLAAGGAAAVVAAEAVPQSEPPDALITSLPAATPPTTRAAKPSSQVTLIMPGKPAWIMEVTQILHACGVLAIGVDAMHGCLLLQMWICAELSNCKWLACPELVTGSCSQQLPTAAIYHLHGAHHLARLLANLPARPALALHVQCITDSNAVL